MCSFLLDNVRREYLIDKRREVILAVTNKNNFREIALLLILLCTFCAKMTLLTNTCKVNSNASARFRTFPGGHDTKRLSHF